MAKLQGKQLQRFPGNFGEFKSLCFSSAFIGARIKGKGEEKVQHIWKRGRGGERKANLLQTKSSFSHSYQVEGSISFLALMLLIISPFSYFHRGDIKSAISVFPI